MSAVTNQERKIPQVSFAAIMALGKRSGAPSPSLPVFFPSFSSEKNLNESNQVSHWNDSAPESKLLCEKINQKYRSQCQDLFLPGDDIYVFAPELTDPATPLRNSLELADAVNELYQKTPLKSLKKPAYGMSGKVKFVRFKGDHNVSRWFAIKRPSSIFHRVFQKGNNIQADLTRYENNLKIAVKIGNHPNFMKVHGITVKKIKGGTQSKPYLIMECVHGERLRDLCIQTEKERVQLFSQLKDALTHLYQTKILPADVNQGNFLITPKNELKLIDFDIWKDDSEITEESLGKGLLGIAQNFLKGMLKVQNINPPSLSPPVFANAVDFKKALDQLFESAVKSEQDVYEDLYS